VDTAWLSIRPEHLRLALPEQPGLPARISGIVELGAVRVLTCYLSDRTPVTLHRPWDEPLPAPGSKIRLHLPLRHLRFLVDYGMAEPVTSIAAPRYKKSPSPFETAVREA
jgi:hypothetical protein